MKSLYLILLGVAMVSFCNAQNTLSQIELESFASGYSSPVGIYSAGDARLFILEQSQADIEIVDLSGNYIGKFLDLTGTVGTGGERGLLGLAFHPDYATNGKFYVNYTNTSGNTVIAEYSVSANPDVADASSGVIILTITQDFSNHNGGHIEFGPDGMLYIGMGDGGSGGDPNNRAQNPQSLLGKMLRIEVTGNGSYSIPSDNPFIGSTTTLDEIWAVGLRNPWKFDFDDLTGDLWIGDVGQNAIEEIDFQPASSAGGENYGWKCFEGTSPFSAGCGGLLLTDPVAEYGHGSPDGFCSITGGVVYRGSAYPNMFGHYFLTDYCDGSIFSLFPDGLGGYEETEVSSAGNFGYVAFGEDMNGEMYLIDVGGTIFKVTDPCVDYTVSISTTATGFTASTADSYEWYLDGVQLTSEVGQTLTATADGYYYCIGTSADGCMASSNTIGVVVGGIHILGCINPCSSNFDPMATIDNGTCNQDGICNNCPGDLNDDGEVTAGDLSAFLSVFGSSCN